VAKRHKHKNKGPFATIENPVCPCCARRDQLFEDPELDAMGMTGCARCNVQFWFEEIEEPGEDEDGEFDLPWETGKGAKRAKDSARVFEQQAHPTPGKMVELTHAAADSD
jgi:hypothetical protein